MKPSDLVEELLGEAVRLDPNDPLIIKVMTRVQNYIGDVVGEETSEEVARGECWDLAIDTANELIRDRETAIAVAHEVCAQMGYKQKGYRPAKRKPVQPVWPPRVSGTPADTDHDEPERIVKPTGVVHGPYKLPPRFHP